MILALATREPMKRRPGVGTQANQAGVPDEPLVMLGRPAAPSLASAAVRLYTRSRGMRPRRRRPRREPAGPLVALTTRVPRSLRQGVRLVCVEQDREMQDFIAEALREYLLRQRR